MRSIALVCFLWFGLATGVASAASVIETNDRLEINWSTLKIRFYGQANASTDGDGLKGVEKHAWHEGVNYATDAVRNLNIAVNEPFSTNPEKLGADAKQAAHQVSTATYSLNTIYYGDGTVRVMLESMLPKALETSVIRFRQKEASDPAMTQFTGVILQSDKALKPRATYQVVDEGGAVLFDVKDMAQESYRKNLMGRWFRHPTANELAEVVGKSPITIHATAADGHFIVKHDEWDKAVEGHKSLLINGTVALALP